MSRQVFPKLQTRNCHTNKTVHVTIYLNFHVFITFTGIVAKKKKKTFTGKWIFRFNQFRKDCFDRTSYSYLIVNDHFT